ncbi:MULTISPECIES: MgtC/SapB family protein [unclassified Candidatus Sulfotelmatobacter]|uniref:MgtC/SapB family protein n=1 Tax=unclassified Candidatus Sulfotelmatobacter TaxID=2635724 RepID=UPI0028039EBE|nr:MULTISPECIES: MgtC/SapB family protein [unclassified Candidatus Sulfotelmatobacter]
MWELDDHVWAQVSAVLLAFGLCTVMGTERQLRRKSAGMRTHALVGSGSAILTLVSAYGFQPLPGIDQLPPDPSRIAAQVVTGIGFLGAGIIFLRKEVVHGLTTAASVWVAAAVGIACGAGLFPLAVVGTLIQLTVALLLTPLSAFLLKFPGHQTIELRYEDGKGVLRAVLTAATDLDLAVRVVRTDRVYTRAGAEVVMVLKMLGRTDAHRAVVEFSEVPGVVSAAAMPEPEADE